MLYQSIRDDKFGVTCDDSGEMLLPETFNTFAKAKAEAERRNKLAVLGVLPVGPYRVVTLQFRPEARPYDPFIPGNGFGKRYRRNVTLADLG